jgi:hypothetical protein
VFIGDGDADYICPQTNSVCTSLKMAVSPLPIRGRPLFALA